VVKKKKVVLITGAGSGLGKAIAQHLALNGHHIIGTDVNSEHLAALQSVNIITRILDVTKEESINAAYVEISKRYNGLDVIINNAGIFDQVPMVEGGVDRFEQLLQVNVLGAYRVTNIFFPMLYKNKGRIINISSETARTLLPFQTYGSSKYMMEAWSNTLRMELKLLGMHVSLIRAGGHKTPLMDKTLEVLNNVPNDSIYLNALKKIKDTGGKKVRAVNKDPLDVAKVVLKAITLKNPKRIYSVNESSLFRFLSIIPGQVKEFLVLGALRKA
jgi:NAD(P)-dependent dehydrogenase (short-subunit alcohol dehydrogenase family)